MHRVQAPLTIGVTGHRDLRADDLEHLERKVKQVLERLRRHYPNTPLILLSALAEGADRLVARVALQSEFGAKLVVPLPMPRELYALDFEEPGSLEEFDQLLEQADRWFELSTNAPLEALLQPGRARDRCYEEVGMFIVRQCQLLIALWDGRDSGKTGGTSEVVRFHTAGIRSPGEDELQPPELFPAYHILTPRRSNPAVQGEPYGLKEIYPPVFHREGPAAAYYARVFGNLEEFNRKVAEEGPELTKRVEKSKRVVTGKLDASKLSTDEALALDRYAVADTLAVELQHTLIRTQVWLHYVVWAWFACFVCFAHLETHFGGWLALYSVLLLVSGSIVSHAKRTKLDDRCLDYRAMAEGCRVKFFWMLAGIADSVPDNYLAKQRTEMDWTRSAQRGWEIGPVEASPETFSNLRERFDFVLRHWIDEQRQYFTKAAKRDRANLHFWERWSRLLLGAAVGISVPLFILVITNQVENRQLWTCTGCEWIAWFVIPVDVLLAAAALTHHFNGRMAYSEHTKQYHRMEGIFGHASRIVQEKLAAGDAEGVRQTFRNLGKEALAENADWVLLHRERPLELPHP